MSLSPPEWAEAVEEPTPAPLPFRLPPPQGRSPSGASWGRRLVWLAIIGGLGFGGWRYGWPLLSGGRQADRPLTAEASRGELKITITERGELESIDAVQVSCDLEGGGKLVSIVAEGSLVHKGDEVAKLDTDVLLKLLNEQDVKAEQASGKVRSGRSELSQAKNKAASEISKAELALTLAKIDLESYEDPQGEFIKERDKLKGALELARKESKEAEDDLEFTRGLVKKGFAQLDTVRLKELTVQQRRFNATSAEAELTLLEKFKRKRQTTELKAKATEAVRELDRTKESQQSLIDKAEGELKAAISTATIESKHLERMKAQVARCTIKAPSDGIVVYSNSRYWDESSRIRPGGQLYYRQEIFSLPDLSKMRVKMKVHESVVKKVQAGQSATMQIEALANQALHGKVIKIATIAQTDGFRGGGVKQYETEVSIDDFPADAGLKPGMSAEVKILVNTLVDAVTIPVSAVAEYEGTRVCYISAGGVVERREVSVGESNDQYIQVTAGLEAGEAVALDARTRAATDAKAAKPQAGKDAPAKPPDAAVSPAAPAKVQAP